MIKKILTLVLSIAVYIVFVPVNVEIALGLAFVGTYIISKIVVDSIMRD